MHCEGAETLCKKMPCVARELRRDRKDAEKYVEKRGNAGGFEKWGGIDVAYIRERNESLQAVVLSLSFNKIVRVPVIRFLFFPF